MRTSEDAKWRDLVGGFILAFGEIELFTYLMWPSCYPKQEVPDKFADRISQLVDALKKKQPRSAAVIGALREAKGLAKRRNTIAHNPASVQVYEHTKTGELFFERAIQARRGKDYITDAELQKLRNKAEDLARRLYGNVGVFNDKDAG